VRRLLPLVLLLVFASSASAATIRGTKAGELIAGTPGPDRIVAGAGNDRVQVAFGGVDRVDCGAGTDVVTADASDKVAANCEIVSRRLSVDPYANADSQHETAVEPDSAAFGSTVVAVFQVGRREAGASSNIGTAVSTNGGRTWQRSFLPGTTVNATPAGPENGASDPSVAYDAVHGVWLVSVLTIERSFSHLYIARSTDGRSWSPPIDAAAGPVLDKEWVTCDNGATSPFRGRCYLEYTDDDKGITVSQYSTDGGLTWSPPLRAGSILVGTQPVVRPDGTLVVVAGDYRGQDALTGSIVALRSTDGGATFARFVVSDLQSADNGPMRAIALPSVDADSNGTIYAVWHDCRFRPGCTRNDLVISTSTDGVTWTPPTRIPPVADTVSSFIPGLAADPQHPGTLAVVSAFFPNGSSTLGMALATSSDGGKTWHGRVRLDAQPMQMSWLPRSEGGRMVGDYFSISYVNGRPVAVFTLAASPLEGRFREAIFARS
jgi:BNR repeat-like domain/RTX calcium-binding nonapeptide repeat (4 copies)